ncbi:glycosyltransferase [Chryseobacterium rhizoplanae]|uniref:glycosyltransferase family 2 protein n=1 Tax=Chryseobacterium rhizoplanae TaxID=1609531 RepID=UPI001CE2ABFD|nr:glycosyltransferase family 2 protein [Chryseobacterium rhizoplanae]UCA61706.1 glycosyltransferase [Chryseobacterium rhizoplanae]
MKISVIIPVYNTRNLISDAVYSALQFDEVYEVILIEDGSSDNSFDVCKNLSAHNSRVQFFYHENRKHMGSGISRNLGIQNASGDYIAFLDPNYYYLPNRFNAEKKIFRQYDIDGVCGSIGIHYDCKKAKEKHFQVYRNHLIPGNKKCYPATFTPDHSHHTHFFDQFSINALTVRKDRLLEKMHHLFKPYPFQEDIEFSIRISYYLNLYYGILHKPVAMLKVREVDTVMICTQNEEVVCEKSSHESLFLSWLHHLHTLKLLIDSK